MKSLSSTRWIHKKNPRTKLCQIQLRISLTYWLGWHSMGISRRHPASQRCETEDPKSNDEKHQKDSAGNFFFFAVAWWKPKRNAIWVNFILSIRINIGSPETSPRWRKYTQRKEGRMRSRNSFGPQFGPRFLLRRKKSYQESIQKCEQRQISGCSEKTLQYFSTLLSHPPGTSSFFFARGWCSMGILTKYMRWCKETLLTSRVN